VRSGGYLTALGLVAVSIVVRSALADYLGPNAPYLQFFPAILVASWYGGFGPGVLATVLSALAASQFYLPPAGLAIQSADDALSLALFTAIGIAIASLNGRLRTAHEEARAEAALATARAERLDAVINTAVDSIVVIDARGRIESFNPAATRLFGYAEDEVRGQNVNVLMPSPYRDEHDLYLSRYLSTGDPKIIGIGREVTGRRKDGSVFPLHLSVGETMAGGERKFTGILHDLTARVALEERLRDQTALAKLGEMAAMIAHEVKNPLAGIRGAVQIIGGRMPADNTDTLMMKEIVRRIDSLDAMMKDLLLFARPPKPKRMPTEIVALLMATAGLLKEDAGARDIQVDIKGLAPPVPADGEMLKMVFHNLLINGAHAMGGRGRIRVNVTTENATCQIAVSDDGPGIPLDVQEKVFIPFFTTKRRGTGLGLPTARRFIEAHDGRITIQSPPSGGTTVTVQLPLN
jgi:two-component system sensor kinase FixL